MSSNKEWVETYTKAIETIIKLQEKIKSLEEDAPFDEELQETFDDYSSAVPATYGQCEGCKRVYKLTKTKSCTICGILLRRISESQ